MDSYGQATSGHLQALDFTSSFKQDNVAQPTMEAHPVLDLSCKKQTAASNLTMHFDERLTSTASDKQTGGHFSDHDSKSPFEGRTFMVTPPSETDSPKKIKYESIFTQNQDQINVIAGESVGHHVYPLASVGIPIPVTTVLPALIAQNVAPNKSNSLPVTTTVTSPALSPELNKKAPRPFKAYPKDPLSLTVGTAELMYDQNSNEAYSEFRKRMLESVRRTNEGTNIKMRRVTKSPGLPTSTVDEKDAAYWERRRKNNEAAKRSRDARRAKEDEIAIRAAFLEQENMKLKYELVALRNETAKLRCMVYSN